MTTIGFVGLCVGLVVIGFTLLIWRWQWSDKRVDREKQPVVPTNAFCKVYRFSLLVGGREINVTRVTWPKGRHDSLIIEKGVKEKEESPTLRELFKASKNESKQFSFEVVVMNRLNFPVHRISVLALEMGEAFSDLDAEKDEVWMERFTFRDHVIRKA